MSAIHLLKNGKDTYSFPNQLVLYVPENNKEGKPELSLLKHLAESLTEIFGGVSVTRTKAFWMAGEVVKNEDVFHVKVFLPAEGPTAKQALDILEETCRKVGSAYMSWERNGTLRTKKLSDPVIKL